MRNTELPNTIGPWPWGVKHDPIDNDRWIVDADDEIVAEGVVSVAEAALISLAPEMADLLLELDRSGQVALSRCDEVRAIADRLREIGIPK